MCSVNLGKGGGREKENLCTRRQKRGTKEGCGKEEREG